LLHSYVLARMSAVRFQSTNRLEANRSQFVLVRFVVSFIRRFGRSALLAALAALAIALIQRIALQVLAQAVPSIAGLEGISVPAGVALPLPAFLDVGSAVIRGLELSAAAGLFVFALRGMPGKAWARDAVAIAAMFCVSLDSSVSAVRLPFTLIDALTLAVAVWIVVRFVLRDNLLAYPAAGALAILLGNAATLLQNHRIDLTANGIADLVAAAVLMAWLAWYGWNSQEGVTTVSRPRIPL